MTDQSTSTTSCDTSNQFEDVIRKAQDQLHLLNQICRAGWTNE